MSAAGPRPVALITGAGRGIGRAIGLRLAASHDCVLVARDAAALERAAAALPEPARAAVLAADVGVPETAQRAVDVALGTFGRLDVLINNAGFAPRAAFSSFTAAALETALRVNVAAVHYFCRAAWGPLQVSRGAIVNISSLAARDPFAGFAVYGACKAYVEAFTASLAGEGRPVGVRVFAVAPGAVDTVMLRAVVPEYPPGAALQPADVAAVVAALTEEQWRHASGQTIVVRQG